MLNHKSIITAFENTAHTQIPDAVIDQIIAETGYPKEMLSHRWKWFADVWCNLCNTQPYSDIVYRPKHKTLGMVWAGNIPGSGMVTLFHAVIAGWNCIIKPSSRDSIFTHWFINQLVKSLPELQSIISFHDEIGHAHDTIYNLFKDCHALAVYGSDNTITRFSELLKKPILKYGHKMSAGWIPNPEATEQDTFNHVAQDICLFDRRGCLSPQVFWVKSENNDTHAKKWAEKLADAMQHIRDSIPMGNFTEADCSNIRQWLGSYLFKPDVSIIIPENPIYEAVLYCKEPFFPLPEARIVMIRPYSHVDEMLNEWTKWKQYWQGLVIPENYQDSSMQSLGVDPMNHGFSYIATPGMMHYPPLQWHNSNINELSWLMEFQ